MMQIVSCCTEIPNRQMHNVVDGRGETALKKVACDNIFSTTLSSLSLHFWQLPKQLFARVCLATDFRGVLRVSYLFLCRWYIYKCINEIFFTAFRQVYFLSLQSEHDTIWSMTGLAYFFLFDVNHTKLAFILHVTIESKTNRTVDQAAPLGSCIASLRIALSYSKVLLFRIQVAWLVCVCVLHWWQRCQLLLLCLLPNLLALSTISFLGVHF